MRERRNPVNAKLTKGKKSRGVEKAPGKERAPTVPVPSVPRTEEERARAATFAKIVDAMIDPVFVLDLEGRCVSANRAYFQMFGHEPEDIVGKPIVEMPAIKKQKPEEVEKFMPLIGEAIERGSAGPVELVLVSMDGREIPLSLAGGVIKDAQCNPTHIVAVLRDITELKRTEEVLKQSEETHRNLLDMANALIQSVNADGRFIYVNKEWKKMLGYTDEDLKKITLMDVIRKDHQKYCMDVFKQVMKGKTVRDVETVFVAKDGREIMVSGNAQSILKDGEFASTVGFFVDITEHKKAEERLRASENKYRTLLENLPQKIFLKNRNSVYISCNENYARDRKIKPEELVGKTDYDFYPKELAEKYRANDKRVMESGETIDVEEEYIQEGQEVITHTVKTPVKDEQGNIIGLLGIFWDITERKRAAEKLRKRAVIIDLTTDAVITMDLKGNIISCNKGAEMMYGYTAKEMIGNPIAILYPKQELPELEKIVGDLLKGKKISNIEITVKHKNKKLLPIIISLAPIKDEKGKVIELVGIAQDITERKQAEEVKLKAAADKQRMEELEKFTKIAVGRELKMVELKERIKALELRLEGITEKG